MKHIHLILLAAVFLLMSGCQANSDPKFVEFGGNNLALGSTIFSLHSEEKEIFIEQYKTYYYAHFELRSPLPLTLSSTELIDEFEIRPESYGIEGRKEGNSIQFNIDRPGYVMVKINKQHRIFILADSPQENDALEAVSILDYNVDNTGNELATAGLQKALDEISGTGKILEFPAGVYKTGRLSIKSNSKIHLTAGAILLGPDDVSALKTEDNIRPRCFIMIKDAENIEISGRGIIDANGRHLRDKFGDEARCRSLLILNSKNVTVDGIILRNSGSWNTQILYSEDVVIRNIKMLNDIDLSNTDGFDPDASKRVLIENCFAYCGDDNVAIKTTNTDDYLQDVEDITVRGCVFLTKKSALKVGTESRATTMKNITFENNDVLECDRGMTLYCYDGASYENIRYINNRFERNYPDRNQCGIHFRLKKRNKESKIGAMTQVLVKDCSFSNAFPNPFKLEGYDDDHKIELLIENLTIEGEACTSENEASLFASDFAEITYR